MDIVSGISAAATAVRIAKDLREIDRSVDEASFKLKLADLTAALADAKISLSEAKVAISEKDQTIMELQRRIETLNSGDGCPICGIGKLKIDRIIPHPTFGEVGVQEKHLSCENPACSHSEKLMHDPIGILDK